MGPVEDPSSRVVQVCLGRGRGRMPPRLHLSAARGGHVRSSRDEGYDNSDFGAAERVTDLAVVGS